MKPEDGFYYTEILTRSHDELTELYNIEVNPSGSVYDLDENCRFDSLSDWAKYKDESESFEEDDSPSFEKIKHKFRFDDD